MTAAEYAKQFENFPTYHKIAMDAFKAGLENATTTITDKALHVLYTCVTRRFFFFLYY